MPGQGLNAVDMEVKFALTALCTCHSFHPCGISDAYEPARVRTPLLYIFGHRPVMLLRARRGPSLAAR